MELFLLLVPAIFIPVGLSIAGIWWLLSNNDEGDYEGEDDNTDVDDFGGF